MKSKEQSVWQGKEIFVGIDIHKKNWTVTGLYEGEQILHSSIPGDYKALESVLKTYVSAGAKIKATYEACGFGYKLYDQLKGSGHEVLVAAPSKILKAPGERVKTDKRDSKKLTNHLYLGILSMVPVPNQEERIERDILRVRVQLKNQSTRIKLQIKARLRFFGYIRISDKKWSKAYKSELRELSQQKEELRVISIFLDMLDSYDEKITEVEAKIILLSEAPRYRRNYELLKSIPGVGEITAMTVLVELQNFKPFSSAKRLASYVGLVPGEYSSGEKKRQGSITKTGNRFLRRMLVEAAWVIIRKDGVMQTHYRKIVMKNRGNQYAKQIAIVAVARKLLMRMYGMVRTGRPYVAGLIE